MKSTLYQFVFFITLLLFSSCSGGIPSCDEVDQPTLLKEFLSQEMMSLDKKVQQKYEESSNIKEKGTVSIDKEKTDLLDSKRDSIRQFHSKLEVIEIIEVSDYAGLIFHTCYCQAVYDKYGKNDQFNFELAQSDDDFSPFLSKVNGKTIRKLY